MPEYVPYLSSNIVSIKVPLLLPRGFSANLILLLWFFLGGVCQWGFEGNILSLMFKAVFEDPVDTAQDIDDRGLIPFVYPGQQFYVDFLASSDNPLYTKLANITVIPKTWEAFWILIQHGVQGNATHVFLGNTIWGYMRRFGRYHYSQELLEGAFGYGGFIVNKHYYLRNDLAKHILIFQQVYQIFLIFIQ